MSRFVEIVANVYVEVLPRKYYKTNNKNYRHILFKKVILNIDLIKSIEEKGFTCETDTDEIKVGCYQIYYDSNVSYEVYPEEFNKIKNILLNDYEGKTIDD